MTNQPRPWQGPRSERDRLDHSWRCTRGGVAETVTDGRVTLVCLTCGANDDDRDTEGEAA